MNSDQQIAEPEQSRVHKENNPDILNCCHIKPVATSYVPYAGPKLLDTPLLNKGTAFSPKERIAFNLEGLLPQAIETLDEQVERAYQQYLAAADDMGRHIYLRNLQDTNETLFYRLIGDHLTEMMPLIYTPTVGQACQEFSDIYRRHRGLFIAYPDRERIDDILDNATHNEVKVIVVTDGERILGWEIRGSAAWGSQLVNSPFTPLVVGSTLSILCRSSSIAGPIMKPC